MDVCTMLLDNVYDTVLILWYGLIEQPAAIGPILIESSRAVAASGVQLIY